MGKLAVWGTQFWEAVLADEEAAQAVDRMQRDAFLVLRAAREVLTTSRMLALAAAIGHAAADRRVPDEASRG